MSEEMILGISIYLIIVNFVGFLSMLIDKRRAIKNKWRISEKSLFIIAVIGGSIGSILGMKLFRHKTKHIQFRFGMPAILIMQIITEILVFGRFFL